MVGCQKSYINLGAIIAEFLIHQFVLISITLQLQFFSSTKLERDNGDCTLLILIKCMLFHVLA